MKGIKNLHTQKRNKVSRSERCQRQNHGTIISFLIPNDKNHAHIYFSFISDSLLPWSDVTLGLKVIELRLPDFVTKEQQMTTERVTI
jgi:hypothetical protein